MWNNYPGNHGHQQGYPQPNGPPPSGGPPNMPSPNVPGYNPGYAPSYGPPPGGFAPPPGAPPPQHHQHHQQGGYPPPSGLPPGYGGGPPPIPANRPGGMDRNYAPPSGPPPSSYGGYQPPSGPPPHPPSQMQNYGPSYQGADNRQHQMAFQYSQCNGKKKALCIGINYFGQSGELKGCINDAHNVQRFLIEVWGYKSDDVVMLTDDSGNPRSIPTRDNIIAAMQWLVRGAQPNDSLFFHYSGHGGQTKDLDGDEGDGYDEVVYPVDYNQAGHLVDDLMHDIMVKPLPPGCRLTAIFDSCHSGSALDLPYIYSTEGKVKEPNLAAEAGQGVMSAVTSYARGDMKGVFSSVTGLVKTATGSNQRADKLSKATKTSPADVISWSGCKDSQTSADTVEAGQSTGAMSFAFISCLRQNKQQSYQQLLVGIRSILKAKYSQKPQLSSSHPMDVNLLFMC
ncbi:metacaspase [Epithele typhae]|uniref:metacaspase n=1 Tax=Epithele typhae TaxID=378194 RepID=UPI0020078429|nr:metacaspase [Epithele typhae]KAH9945391.1 metacaspase [Epithele typhae]